MANDAAEVAPNVYRVLFDHDRVRLLEARVRPGDRSAMHAHPDYLVYGLGDGTVTFTSSSGRSAELALKAAETRWREAEEAAAKKLGTADVTALVFELK